MYTPSGTNACSSNVAGEAEEEEGVVKEEAWPVEREG